MQPGAGHCITSGGTVMEKALLLGNGLNRLYKNYSWEDLIRDLIDELNLPQSLGIKGKPFPLLYEEIVQTAFDIGIDESDVKANLAKLVEQIKSSSLHPRIKDLGTTDVLTTNYDYNVEDCWQTNPTAVDVTETKYSLFRRKSYPELNIWHIHGERDRADSILLGYSHYADYLESMRTYMFKGASTRKVDPLRDRIKRDRLASDGVSWLDFFFNRNLYIVGLTLDYTEIHLWWLITYRARMQSQSDYPIRNTVTYLYPKFLANEIRSRLQLLKGNGVRLRQLQVSRGAWLKFYGKALDVVRSGR